MGKNANKKGKQKEATSTGAPAPLAPPPAPPPPPPATHRTAAVVPITRAPSPPTAKHIEHPRITIDTIEEEDTHAGPSGELPLQRDSHAHRISGASIYGEDSWEDGGQRDVTDAGDWRPDPNDPGNDDEWGATNDIGWQTNPLPVPQISELTSSSPLPPLPPPPPPLPAAAQQQKNGGKAQVKQQQQHRAQPQQHQHQHQHQRRQNANTPAMGQAAWNHQEGMNKTSWNTSKNQNAKGAWNTWAAESAWAQTDWQADDREEDEWDAASNSWTHQGSGWGPTASLQSAQTHATSRQQHGGWQNWGAEAQRLPKVTFDPAIPPSPSTAGNRLVLSQHEQSRILNSLLNQPQQNHQPFPNPRGVYPPAATLGWNQIPQQRPPQNAQQPQQQHFQQPPQQHFQQPPQQHFQQLPQQHFQQPPQQHFQQRPQQQPFFHEPQQPSPQHDHHDGKKHKKNKQQSKKQKKHQQETNDVWGLGDGWCDREEEDENDTMHDAWGQKASFPPQNNGINGVSTPAPAPVDPFSIHASPANKLGLSINTNDANISKTLSYAYRGSGASPGTGRMAMKMLADVHFTESQGNAIKGVWNAFYNKSRKASERFHWLFPAEKDDRVADLLDWIDTMAFAIASFGVSTDILT